MKSLKSNNYKTHLLCIPFKMYGKFLLCKLMKFHLTLNEDSQRNVVSALK